MKISDVDLIQRILDGDESAFTMLVNKYQKWVHTLVWRRIGDFHTAEEITQDVFLKVYKKLSMLKNPDQFPGWLYVIATRRCLEWLRKKKFPTKSLDAMSTTELEELCYEHYETEHGDATGVECKRELVKRLLQKLPESERTVVTLYYLAEMTSEEISTFLGVSPNTVRSRLHRARKRLEKQEHLLHNVSGIFQLPPSVIGNIMDKISRIKPTTPSVSKPWVPWALSFSATLLVILMMGVGPRALSRFQQPYNLDAASEMIIELVDAPVMFDVKREPDARNQFGIADTEGRGTDAGPKDDAGLLAAAQADTAEVLKTEPRWTPAKGPEGERVKDLFITSQKEVYAVGNTQLYRLADNNSEEWTLINAALPFTPHSTPMAERNGTLYIATENDLLTSTDRGVTFHLLGSRPHGRAIALLVPSRLRWSQDAQIEMYLVLADGVFRSTDAGTTWYAFNDGLTAPEIRAAAAIENVPFLGTKQGLYRLNSDVWEKLSVAQSQSIDSLAVAGDKIYINAGRRKDQKSSSLFVSYDFGGTWTDITPMNLRVRMSPLTAGSVKLAAAGETVLALGAGVLRSRDAGSTWEYLGFHRDAFMISFLPAVALSEDTFFIAVMGGVRRSTDGGSSWHLFTAGIAEPHILDLAQVNSTLYAVTNKGVAQSTDGGDQWTQIDTNLPLPPNKPLGELKLSNMTAVGDSLYFRAKQGGSTNCLLHLPPNTDTLLHIEGMPVYVDPSHGEWLEKTIRATATIGLSKADRPDLFRYQLGIEEAVVRTTGEFAVSDRTFYIEYERKLYRWTAEDRKWHDTGMQDAPVFADFYATDGFQFAVSGKIVYLGKSNGTLFQSLDGGDTWRDVTSNFPFQLNRAESQDQLLKKLPHFREIVFVGSTVYVSTNDGVAMSDDGENWRMLTDSRYAPIDMYQLAINGTTLYGVSGTGAYRLNKDTGIWEQIASEIPGRVTSLAVARDTLYIGTEHSGMLRFQRND